MDGLIGYCVLLLIVGTQIYLNKEKAVKTFG